MIFELQNELIDLLLQQFPNGIVAFDLEMTGLSPAADQIVELGAVKIDDKGELQVLDFLIDPLRPIPPKITEIHGITNAMVEGKRNISEVMPKFLEFLGDLPLVAHNAQFDVGFLVHAIHRNNLSFSESEIFDSWLLARQVLKKRKSQNVEAPDDYRLGTLAKFLDIPLDTHHRAYDDALASLWIFGSCIKILKQIGKLKDFPSKALLYHFDQFRKVENFELPDQLEDLHEIIAKQEIIEIEYRGKSIKDRFRPIRPISFLPTPQGQVLYSLCVMSNMMKSFKVDKIKSWRRLPENQRTHWENLITKTQEQKKKQAATQKD
ncbi:MAG: exonuclease domain-containing protein [Bacteriovoracia bacterium]